MLGRADGTLSRESLAGRLLAESEADPGGTSDGKGQSIKNLGCWFIWLTI